MGQVPRFVSPISAGFPNFKLLFAKWKYTSCTTISLLSPDKNPIFLQLLQLKMEVMAFPWISFLMDQDVQVGVSLLLTAMFRIDLITFLW